MTKFKLLVVGPAWVGDMVMAQCLFKLLKQQKPDMEIHVLAPAWSLPLMERMPEVTKGIVMPLKHGQFGISERYRLGKSLKRENYQQTILLPNSFKSALVPFFANIPKRTGWLGELRFGILNDVRYLDPKRYPLMIERFMALGITKEEPLPPADSYPLPELTFTEPTQKSALEKYQLNTEKPVLALCPGAEFGPAKRWPEHHYATVALQKIQEGWTVWILGSAKDNEVAEKIMQATHQQCINLAGRTSLVDAVDLLSLASAVVSNDSGLMHIAAALYKPLVAVYGPTTAAFTPPLHSKARILTEKLACQPCFQRECPLGHHRCMEDLAPKQVLKAISELVS